MIKLPASYEKDILEILLLHKSDESRRSRRNLVVASSIVIVIHLLALSYKSISIFGLKLNEGSELDIISLAIIFILYWLFMFIMHSRNDEEYNTRRRAFFNVERMYTREIEEQINKIQKGEARGTNEEQMMLWDKALIKMLKEIGVEEDEYRYFVSLESLRKTIFEKSTDYRVNMALFEYFIPLFLGGSALLILGYSVYTALVP